MKIFLEFINVERSKFSTRDDSLFALSFSQIARYYEFIKIIQERYHKISAEFIENLKAQQDKFQSETHTMTDEEMRLFSRGQEITTILHLEIESHYLFAKIFLDKMARAIEFYFGQERSLPLDSHHDLVKNFENYVSAKQLTTPSVEFNELIRNLKECVSDYRDREIAHEKSPRTIKATMFSHGATNTTCIASTRIYPTEKDKQVESKEIDQIMIMLDKYIDQIIKYIQMNSAKTCLEKVGSAR